LKPSHGWVGGKRFLAKEIVTLIPSSHNLYIEVFGGALNVFYAKKNPTKGKYREVVNDFNSDLINLHRTIRNNPRLLSKYLNHLFVSRELFQYIKSGKYQPRNRVEKASFYYYRLQMSFGAKGDNFAMSAKSRKPKNIYKDFLKWSQRLKGVTIENMDFEKLIKNYDRAESFFYCDPPYVSTESYYKNIKTFDLDDHKRLYLALKQIKGKFLLSYNDTPFIRDLYKDFKIIESGEIEYILGKNFHGKSKRVRELFIVNY
jgi:DNA adenine methylase